MVSQHVRPTRHIEQDSAANRQVGIRALKEQMSEMFRHVEGGETIDVTRRGRVVARIVPAEACRPVDLEAIDTWWAEHLEFAREISDGWPEGVTAVDAIRDVRE